MNTDIEKIKQSGRDAIIQMAIHHIQKHLRPTRTIHADNFDKIRVLANKTEIRVEFSNPIKYVPLNTSYYYDINIDILKGTIWYDVISNPSDHDHKGMEVPFFFSTEESEKHIQFVIDAFNQAAGRHIFDNKKDYIEKMADGNTFISDNPEYYQIEEVSEYQVSWFKINKLSGEIYDDGHAHMDSYPQDEEDEFEEIKE